MSTGNPNRDLLNNHIERIKYQLRKVEDICPMSDTEARHMGPALQSCLAELRVLQLEQPHQAFNFLGLLERLKSLSATAAAVRHDLDRIEPLLDEARKLTIEAVRIVEHTDDDL